MFVHSVFEGLKIISARKDGGRYGVYIFKNRYIITKIIFVLVIEIINKIIQKIINIYRVHLLNKLNVSFSPRVAEFL